jgi:ketosteroid isomerase-like protein
MAEPIQDQSVRFFTALSRGDGETALAMVTDDFELHLPTAPRGVPKLISGRDGLAAMVGNIGNTFTGIDVRIVHADAFAGDPDRGVMRTEVTATNRDGTPYRNDYVILMERVDGRIRRWTEYYDPAPMVRTLDALRAALKAGTAR